MSTETKTRPVVRQDFFSDEYAFVALTRATCYSNAARIVKSFGADKIGIAVLRDMRRINAIEAVKFARRNAAKAAMSA